jgi:hypothetical protein
LKIRRFEDLNFLHLHFFQPNEIDLPHLQPHRVKGLKKPGLGNISEEAWPTTTVPPNLSKAHQRSSRAGLFPQPAFFNPFASPVSQAFPNPGKNLIQKNSQYTHIQFIPTLAPHWHLYQ